MKKLLLGLCCLGVLNASAQKMEWFSLWGSSTEASHISAKRMVIDSEDNVYTAASFSGNMVAVESETLVSQQGTDLGDAVLIKTTPNKDVVWSVVFAESKTVAISDMAIDNQDNVVVVGVFDGKMNPNGQGQLVMEEGSAGDNTANAFVSRFDKNGNLLKQWAIPGYVLSSIKVSVDKDRNIYVGGIYGSSVEIGGVELGEFATDNQYFLAKYTANGDLIWHKHSQSQSISYTNATIQADAENGDVYFGGTFTGTLLFAGKQLITGPGENDMFLVKYSSDGTEKWAKRMGGDKNENGLEIAISPLGDVALGGSYTSGYMTVSDLDSTLTYQYRGADTSYPHLSITTFTKDGDFRWQYWYGYSNTSEAVLNTLRCSDEGIYHIGAHISGRAGDMSTGTVIAGQNSGVKLIDGQHISHNTNGGADALYLALSPEGGLCNIARPGGQQTERLRDIALSADKKSIYFMYEFVVRKAIAQIPINNFWTSFSDINSAGKTGDFTMITVPCPETVSAGGSYSEAYVGKFYSACLMRCSFPEITPNDLPKYTGGVPYSQAFSMANPAGEALFIPVNLSDVFSFNNNELAGSPAGNKEYSITMIASDKTPRYSYFSAYAGDTQWDDTYGGETTRGNSRNVRNFILKSTDGTGVSINSDKNDVCVFYPTIVDNVLNVRTNSDSFSVNIYSIVGARVLVSNGQKTINMSALPSGVYIAEIITADNQRAVERIIVK